MSGTNEVSPATAAGQGHSPPYIKGGVSRLSREDDFKIESPFNPPVEVVPGQTRILLSESASRHLDSIGAECFVIVSKAKTPDVIGRWVIHLVPCSMQTAREAEAVLLGKAKATFPKPSKPVPSAALTPHEIRKA